MSTTELFQSIKASAHSLRFTVQSGHHVWLHIRPTAHDTERIYFSYEATPRKCLQFVAEEIAKGNPCGVYGSGLCR